MTARSENALKSVKELENLRKNFYFNDDRHYMSLELGKRHGLKAGYPRLSFSSFKDTYTLEAWELQKDRHDPYEESRPLSLGEINIFIQAARHFAPESHITNALARESARILTEKFEKLKVQLNEVEKVLNIIDHK